jgi:hypothetical protein
MLGTLAFRDTLSYPVSNVTTATTATTLTSISTLLQITPASYGVAVTLPDATTCNIGGPLHIIDNKGAYPVRVLNNAGTLLGFIFAGVVSHISLADNSTAAGVWTIENNELVGASAQLLTTNLLTVDACVSLDSDREFLLGNGGSNYSYGVVYNKTTNSFGSVTAIRSSAVTGKHVAIKSAMDQILVVSCTSGSTALEAVCLTITGTSIAVGTAATATLSANISAFADGCGLIAVGSSFVTSYTVATPAAQIRALSISGTTVTIGSAEVLGGTTGGLIVAASSTIVIAVSGNATVVTTTPYTVSGSTLSAGTGSTTGSLNTKTVSKLFALGSRWCVLFLNGGTDLYGGIISLSGTTTTVSAVYLEMGAGSVADAMLVSASKAIVLGTATTNNANILTDTAGTASVGTAITLDANSTRICLYTYDSTAVVVSGDSYVYTSIVDCSGASPVLTKKGAGVGVNFPVASLAASNSVLSRAPNKVFGASFAQNVMAGVSATTIWSLRVEKTETSLRSPLFRPMHIGTAHYRGRSASEVWVTDTTSVVTKMECVA